MPSFPIKRNFVAIFINLQNLRDSERGLIYSDEDLNLARRFFSLEYKIGLWSKKENCERVRVDE